MGGVCWLLLNGIFFFGGGGGVIIKPENIEHIRPTPPPPPPPHTPSTRRVGHYRVVVYPKRLRYVTWYFNMQGFEQSLNAIAANPSAPPQPNSFLYHNSPPNLLFFKQRTTENSLKSILFLTEGFKDEIINFKCIS